MNLLLLIKIALIVILLGASAFFSGSETALFALSPLAFKKMQRKGINTSKITRLLRDPSRILTTIVIGNTVVNIAISALATSLFIQIWGEKGMGMAIGLMTFVLLILGEITPKTYALDNPSRISLIAATPLECFSKFIFPFRILLRKLTDFFVFWLGGKVESGPLLSEEEFQSILQVAKKEGVLKPFEPEMIQSVLKFGGHSVKEIMTPRVEMKAFPSTMSQEEVIELLKEYRHSKVPVYKDTLDEIVGFVLTREILLNPRVDYHKFIRPVPFVPESKKIGDLLEEFLKEGLNLAIVVDEYGGTEGLVTLEDIVEVAFGEIYDEFETPEMLIKRVSEDIYLIAGKTPLEQVNQELSLNLPKGEHETLAGFLMELAGRIPKRGEKFSYDHVSFVVERATPTSIIMVRVIKK